MARIRIDDLPPDTDLTPEELEEIYGGAGRRSFRPTLEGLESREVYAAHLGPLLEAGGAGPGQVQTLQPRTPQLIDLVQQQDITTGSLHTSGNQIVDRNGTPFRIAAVNWSGFEGDTYVVNGLWRNSGTGGGLNYKEAMDQMKKLGFNTIRLPLSSEMLTQSPKQWSIDYDKNPDLKDLNSLQVLDRIVDYAGKIGMKIILDHHSSKANNYWHEPLWYIPGDSTYTHQAWIKFWETMATRYKDSPAVIGADLHNEPHDTATWGSGDAKTDWRMAAEQGGNAVLKVNPNWLIFVEGVQNYKGVEGGWGSNLMGARDHPVNLAVANRLVYSPHAYSWFGAKTPEEWDRNWGYLYREKLAPVWVGEFALTKAQTPADQKWYADFVRYLGTSTGDTKGISWGYFGFTPNSNDTVGVLKDWTSPDQAVMDPLRPIEN